MEGLRRFGRRLLRTKEKVVFGVMVAILIWRVVQIVAPDLLVWPPWERGPDLPSRPPPIIRIEIEDPPPFESGQIDMTRFASVTDNRWELPGETTINPDDESDPGLPEIHLVEIVDVGGNDWAKISVDGERAQLVKPNSYFANRRALLEKVDAEGKKIEFRWLSTNKKYERTLTG